MKQTGRLPSFYQMQVDALIELGADEWHSLKAVKAAWSGASRGSGTMPPTKESLGR
jgi:hypothetical protein